MVQDDRLLLGSGVGIQTQTLNSLQALGVHTIHAVVNWRSIAPGPSSGSKPSFNDSDSTAYPAGSFDVVDSLVRGTNARGMSLLLTIAGPAPNWALKCTAFEKRKYQGHATGTCRPDPTSYGHFATALAKRYNGSFPDPATPGRSLPRVSRWSLWNEPNLNSWITPQVISIRGKRVPVSAQIYRDLVYAGGNALKANGHGSDQILLGETAPIGQGTSRVSPMTFYQSVFCLDSSGHKLKGTAAKNLGCKGRFKKLPVNGVAHHPYTKAATQSLLASQHSADITIAYINRLQNVLRQGKRAHAVGNLPIYLTEFGVSSRPPAAAGKGVPLARQADFINLFEYLAYLNGSVRSVCQFQFQDDTKLLTHTFQTGLEFSNGNQKPAFAAYQVPVFVAKSGHKAKIWGGVRGLRSGTVTILRNNKRLRNATVRNGYFSPISVPSSGKYQVTYTAGGTTLKSRVAKAETVKLPH